MDETDLDYGRPATPTHQPTAGVKISRHEIEGIVSHCLPGSDLVHVKQLESGKSYNNRIYFLSVRAPPIGPGNESQGDKRFVLKVNGKYWGASKIRNEVACLHLINEHCPSVPVPSPVAWSEDGLSANFPIQTQRETTLLDAPSLDTDNLRHGGWILMTTMAGSPLIGPELGHEALIDLAQQLGDIVTSWRKQIPSEKESGNISLVPDSRSNSVTLHIQDYLMDDITFTEPVETVTRYWQTKVLKHINALRTRDAYARNRTLLEPLEAFVTEILPQLKVTHTEPTDQERFIFTHYDLSPRNVLVSNDPPYRITGVVDFEFAGFFPATDEFLNDAVNNMDDWPPAFYQAYLDRLEQNRVSTPSKSFDKGVWDRNLALEKMASNIAPWWLPGGLEGAELEKQLDDAKECVQAMLQELSSD